MDGGDGCLRNECAGVTERESVVEHGERTLNGATVPSSAVLLGKRHGVAVLVTSRFAARVVQLEQHQKTEGFWLAWARFDE